MDPNVLLLIIVAVLLICFYVGRSVGLIRTLIPIASAFASFCLLAAAVPVLEKDVTKYLSGLDIRDAVISVGAFALTFLLAKWLIEKILKFFRIIGDAPVIGKADRLLGGIAGFAGGLVIVWGTFFFLLLFFGPDGLPEFFDAVSKNDFVRVLYNNNLVMTLVNYFIFAA